MFEDEPPLPLQPTVTCILTHIFVGVHFVVVYFAYMLYESRRSSSSSSKRHRNKCDRVCMRVMTAVYASVRVCVCVGGVYLAGMLCAANSVVRKKCVIYTSICSYFG